MLVLSRGEHTQKASRKTNLIFVFTKSTYRENIKLILDVIQSSYIRQLGPNFVSLCHEVLE